MTDEPNQGATGAAAEADSAAAYAAGSSNAAYGQSHGQSPLSVGSQGDGFDERPELFVAGAFVGGIVLAQVLRRLGS